jgi:hypothetical protein
MTDQEIAEILRALGSKSIRLDAKIHALSICMVRLARRQGIPEHEMLAMFYKEVAQSHQAVLEKIEDIDPKSAANLDQRPKLDDL